MGEARTLIDLALAAEQAGWDGFFVYDHIVVRRGRSMPSVDPWTVLAVVAERTQLTFGALITPLARRQPWELAHQTIALDRLSGGRLVLGAGLGEPADHEAFGPERDARALGARLDEGLELVRRMWAGESVTHSGSWRLQDASLAPGPVRGGRIPVWVGGRYGSRAPIRRAARFEGFFPINATWDLGDLLRPAQVAELRSALQAERGELDGFELVNAGVSAGAIDSERVAEFAQAGATWWLEIIEPRRGALDELRARVAAGPPKPAGGPP
jgi:alkanesulfonate monooxygenase SsuD/methylene tetrahydromethanopterin reductase-like flavin-dependent oxidoreductase (luciferase family)